MNEQFSRTAQLIGEENVKNLFFKHVIVFGCGGVGGFVVEALARSGIGKISLVDNDNVNISNINRQIIALHSTAGKQKVDVLKNRILDINPNCQVFTFNTFFLPENSHSFDFSQYDYVVDAVDTVTAKIEIIKKSKDANVPIISSMGTGNKLNPLAFKVADISKTNVCPLARVMRNELKKRGISKVKCVYSEELPVIQTQTPASIAFVPSVAGLLIASEVIKDLMK
ncbi:MAG: tRNA threonylcarbamoyladenosine dehydratase [Paludibacteraceae bacterium]|nr:tRNA threonylcarbamoyladenosine dehydratase [Paludibacteraceae bacterium]